MKSAAILAFVAAMVITSLVLIAIVLLGAFLQSRWVLPLLPLCAHGIASLGIRDVLRLVPTRSVTLAGFSLARVSGRSVLFCTLSGAFLTRVEVPIERRAVDTKLLRHLTC